MKKVLAILFTLSLFLVGCSDNNEEKVLKDWNPYSFDSKHIVTLQDFLISAANGEHIVKMTVSINISSDENYMKFKGLSSPFPTEEKESKEPKQTLTPLEIKINSLIGNIMLKQESDDLLDKDKLEIEVKNYINKVLNEELKLSEDFIKELYIDNYVVQ